MPSSKKGLKVGTFLRMLGDNSVRVVLANYTKPDGIEQFLSPNIDTEQQRVKTDLNISPKDVNFKWIARAWICSTGLASRPSRAVAAIHIATSPHLQTFALDYAARRSRASVSSVTL